MNKKQRVLLGVVVAMAVVAGAVAPAAAQSQEAMMEAFLRFSTPGEGHARLEQMVGTWEVASEWQPPDPDAEPRLSTGEIKMELIFGGRFLHQTQLGAEVMGVPFEGWGIFAFDNFREVFQQIWFDSAGTGILVREGQCADGDCRAIVMYGEFRDPMDGGRLIKTRTVYRTVDADTYVVEHYEQSGDAPERLAIRTTGTRKSPN